MSLFIGSLAFENAGEVMFDERIGIMLGSADLRPGGLPGAATRMPPGRQRVPLTALALSLSSVERRRPVRALYTNLPVTDAVLSGGAGVRRTRTGSNSR